MLPPALAFVPLAFQGLSVLLAVWMLTTHRRDGNAWCLSLSLVGAAVTYAVARYNNLMAMYAGEIGFDVMRAAGASLGAFCTLCLAVALWWRLRYLESTKET